MVIISIIIGIAAVVGTFYNAWVLRQDSRINTIRFIQSQMLTKAKECNELFENRITTMGIGIQVTHLPLLSEMEISIKLLDSTLDSLNSKYLTSKRKYFLQQFWIQLDESIRYFITSNNYKIEERDIADNQFVAGFIFQFNRVKSYFNSFISN